MFENWKMKVYFVLWLIHTLHVWKYSLIDHFSQASQDFSLTISLKKTNVTAQNAEEPPSINIESYDFVVVHQFTYLGSTITNNLSLEAEINQQIGYVYMYMYMLPQH